MSLAPRRATAVAAGLLALVDCTRRQEQRPVGWLKIEVLRPVTGTSGVIVLGSRKEIYWAQAGARWHKIGEGSSTTYMVMKDGAAVLFDTNTKEGLRLIVQGARRAQPVRELVGWRGGNLVVMVPPGRSALDVVDCPSPGLGPDRVTAPGTFASAPQRPAGARARRPAHQLLQRMGLQTEGPAA